MDDGTRELPTELLGQVPPSAPISTGASTSPNYQRLLDNAGRLNAMTRALGPAEFSPRRESSPFEQQLLAVARGYKKLFGAPLGYFAGLSYKQDYAFYEDAVSSRYQQGPS